MSLRNAKRAAEAALTAQPAGNVMVPAWVLRELLQGIGEAEREFRRALALAGEKATGKGKTVVADSQRGERFPGGS